MYLREMGGVELLSREGEIAIAKRIEAGKDYMINGLFQSPITAQKVFEWKEKFEEDKLLIREIIDIDSSYFESETENEDEHPNSKKNKQDKKKKINYELEKPITNVTAAEKHVAEKNVAEKNNVTKETKNQEYVEEDDADEADEEAQCSSTHDLLGGRRILWRPE